MGAEILLRAAPSGPAERPNCMYRVAAIVEPDPAPAAERPQRNWWRMSSRVLTGALTLSVLFAALAPELNAQQLADDCASSLSCRIDGTCTDALSFSDMRYCQASEREDCQRSLRCGVDGNCTPSAGRCTFVSEGWD